MAGRGPAPKPAELRQRQNHKAGAQTLEVPVHPTIPDIPNHDGREWHPLTLAGWKHAWESPMSTQWLQTDVDALGRLAIVWDQFYCTSDAKILAEIRLQEARFGLTPLDRSRLQWEVARADMAPKRPQQPDSRRAGATDPRKLLMMAVK